MMHFPMTIGLTFFGAFYLSFTLNHVFLIRENYGPFYVYFLLLVVVAGDSGAFTFGKLFGRHRMTPLASPNKTWEGSIAGLLSACIGGIVVQQFLLKDAILWKAILFALLIHAAAQISDPLESIFKRAAGVKDSSNALPGHGGILDRIDSQILAAPLFYYLLIFLGMD
jgi:phosphatidate cytidylyltransferase